MSKNVVVISTSLRKRSNSAALAARFAEGARAAGHHVTEITLAGKQIAFCTGCLACQKIGHCVINDDAVAIEPQVLAADVVAFATPIYYYEMSGQMKTLLDRLNPMFPKDYHFRDIDLRTTAADTGSYTPERATAGLTGWIDCFEKASLKGTVFAGGVNDAGDIAGNAKLDEAFAMGKNV